MWLAKVVEFGCLQDHVASHKRVLKWVPPHKHKQNHVINDGSAHLLINFVILLKQREGDNPFYLVCELL